MFNSIRFKCFKCRSMKPCHRQASRRSRATSLSKIKRSNEGNKEKKFSTSLQENNRGHSMMSFFKRDAPHVNRGRSPRKGKITSRQSRFGRCRISTSRSVNTQTSSLRCINCFKSRWRLFNGELSGNLKYCNEKRRGKIKVRCRDNR